MFSPNGRLLWWKENKTNMCFGAKQKAVLIQALLDYHGNIACTF